MAALSSPQLQRFLLSRVYCNYGGYNKTSKNTSIRVKGGRGGTCCSAIAIDAPSSLSGVSSIKWGSTQLQGVREEMEDDLIIVQSEDDLDGFSFAAVFDGHAGFSSVKFLRFVNMVMDTYLGLVLWRNLPSVLNSCQRKSKGKKYFSKSFSIGIRSSCGVVS